MKDITGTRDLSYEELEHKIEELEQCMTDNDDEMQKIVEENKAMKETIANWYRPKKVPAFAPDLLLDPVYFFDKYKDWSKERIIMECMGYFHALRRVMMDRNG